MKMTPVEIVISDVDGEQIKMIALKGEFDDSNMDDKSRIIYDLLETTRDGTHYIFHLEELDDINTKFVAYLEDWNKQVIKSNGKLSLIKAKSHILDILDAVGFTSKVEHHNNLINAKTSLLGI